MPSTSYLYGFAAALSAVAAISSVAIGKSPTWETAMFALLAVLFAAISMRFRERTDA